ncbi:MAG: hypothetical protein KIT57_24430 [Blastocatellales bacterium]|nr:hypothetical protein [Blastocatellales bacterium]
MRGLLVYAQTQHCTPQGRQVSPRTVKQWLTVIKFFLAWKQQRGRLHYNPAEEITLPKVERNVPLALN